MALLGSLDPTLRIHKLIRNDIQRRFFLNLDAHIGPPLSRLKLNLIKTKKELGSFS